MRKTKCVQAKVARSVQTSHMRGWLHQHGYVVKADKLHPAVQRVIAEWFDLVDDDGSRTLEHHELLAALKVAACACVCACARAHARVRVHLCARVGEQLCARACVYGRACLVVRACM